MMIIVNDFPSCRSKKIKRARSNLSHYPKDAAAIVKRLYEQRKPYLQKAGIEMSLNQLLVWYNCKQEPVGEALGKVLK